MSKIKKQIYFWHGEPVNVRFGGITVKEDKKRPMWWHNYECSYSTIRGTAIIAAIEVNTIHKETFYIANHFGIGVHKLMAGGWPSHQHFSFDQGNFHPMPEFRILEFDEHGFAEHEANRRSWQKNKYPKAFEKLQGLLSLFNKGKKS